MGYMSFATTGKNQVKSEDVGAGQINISHLSPALYTEIKKIGLHNHSGANSRAIDLKDLRGAFGLIGFQIYSPDGSRWQVTMGNDGAFDIVEL